MRVTEDTSDGYHTFKELYGHRTALFIALMFAYPERSWFASYHDDGSMFDGGWFVAGIHLPTGDITYHLEDKYFNTVGANKEIEYRHFAPKWDGHSANDVVVRLMEWNNEIGKASLKPKD